MRTYNIPSFASCVFLTALLASMVTAPWNCITGFAERTVLFGYEYFGWFAWSDYVPKTGLDFWPQLGRNLAVFVPFSILMGLVTLLLLYLYRGSIFLLAKKFPRLGRPLNLGRVWIIVIWLGVLLSFWAPILAGDFFYERTNALTEVFHDTHPNPFLKDPLSPISLEASGLDRSLGFGLDLMYLLLDGFIFALLVANFFSKLTPYYDRLWALILEKTTRTPQAAAEGN